MQRTVKHFAAPSFWECYQKLPPSVQDLANRSFERLKANPQHPSLHLKKVGRYWSVRVGKRYRALAVEIAEGLLWFWIGTHNEYDKLVGR
jgi:mRNA-degrading endonuclease RelE of RelBE toxin-antitoxin system